MTVINLITGLMIAAVLFVPGTTQREATQVGEEPALGEISTKMLDASNSQSPIVSSPWHFTGGLGDLPTEADKYQSGSASNCPSGSDTVCELNAPDDGTGQPKMNAEIEVEGVGTRTIAQRINDAIASGNPNETVTLLRSN